MNFDAVGDTLSQDETDERLRAVLFNIDQFDMLAFAAWLAERSSYIKSAVQSCPPNRIYLDTNCHYCYVYAYLHNGKVWAEYIDHDGHNYLATSDLCDVTDEVRRTLLSGPK